MFLLRVTTRRRSKMVRMALDKFKVTDDQPDWLTWLAHVGLGEVDLLNSDRNER